jgi:hypothetical protein
MPLEQIKKKKRKESLSFLLKEVSASVNISSDQFYGIPEEDI